MEVIYQRALALELERRKIQYKREQEITLYYDAIKIGSRKADFIIEDYFLVELKAISILENTHIIQAKNYLTAFRLQHGLLINFGALKLEYKRIYPGNNIY